MCGTLAFFACLDASAKTLAGHGVDPLLSTFMRYAVNVGLVLMVLNPVRTPGVARTNRLGLQVLRSAPRPSTSWPCASCSSPRPSRSSSPRP